MTIETEDLVEQLLPEPVHHRHHDDEGSNPKHDAEKREAGIDRYESFLAPGPQVAQRQHPFERSERVGGAVRLAHKRVPHGHDGVILNTA
jgi:hypothetical protein